MLLPLLVSAAFIMKGDWVLSNTLSVSIENVMWFLFWVHVCDGLHLLTCVRWITSASLEWNQSDHVNNPFYFYFSFNLICKYFTEIFFFLHLSLTGRLVYNFLLFLLLLCLCVVWCKGCQVQKKPDKQLSAVPISVLKPMLAPRLIQNPWLFSALFTLPLF